MKMRVRRKGRKADFISKFGNIPNQKVIPARKPHIKSIAKIYLQEYLRAPYHENWTQKGSMERVRALFRENRGLVAMARNGAGESCVVGFIFFRGEFWFGKRTGFIEELVVQKAFQHHGVGSVLVAHAISNMDRVGAKEIYLLARRSGGPSKFYTRRGFSATKYVLMKRRL